jgi:hypothetical protein
MIWWWVAIVLLSLVPWQAGEMQLWLLPILVWGYYELCACPTVCSVRTMRGGLCRNPAFGRLYACREQPAHARLKNDAFLRLLLMRRSHPLLASPARGPRGGQASRERASDRATVQSRQALMVFLTVAGTIAGVIQSLLAALA